MSASKVSEICTRQVITVDPETTLQEIATIMSEKGVHLLPVVSSGKLVGVGVLGPLRFLVPNQRQLLAGVVEGVLALGHDVLLDALLLEHRLVDVARGANATHQPVRLIGLPAG